MPDYEGESRELTLDKSMSYSMFTYDVLRVTIPSSPIKSVSTSKEDMLTIFYDEGSHEITVMSEVTGKVKITVRTSNGKKLVLALTINDPYVPKALSVTRKNIPLLSGLDIDLAPFITMKPSYARTTFTYRSSNKAVARVNKDGVVTGIGSGRATIYLTSANGLKASVNVKVSPNETGSFHPKPTRADALLLGCKWTLLPKSLALRGNDQLICRLSLLNGDKAAITSLKGLDLGVYYNNGEGDVLVARAAFKRVKSE